MSRIAGLARRMVTTMVLGALGLTATAQQDASKKITPLPGAERSIDDLIGGVRALRKSGDLTRHQEHHFLRLAERADEKFDKGEFSQSLKILGTFQTDLNEELGEGAISQATFDSLNSLDGTAMALVSGQQAAPPTLGIASDSCTVTSSATGNTVDYAVVVSWTNQKLQFTASLVVTITWVTANGNPIRTDPVATFQIGGGGPAQPSSQFPASGSQKGSVLISKAPVGATVAKFTFEIKDAKETQGVNIVPNPPTATTPVCNFS